MVNKPPPSADALLALAIGLLKQCEDRPCAPVEISKGVYEAHMSHVYFGDESDTGLVLQGGYGKYSVYRTWCEFCHSGESKHEPECELAQFLADAEAHHIATNAAFRAAACTCDADENAKSWLRRIHKSECNKHRSKNGGV